MRPLSGCLLLCLGPGQIPRLRSPELDQGPRLYQKLRSPLGSNTLTSVTEAGPDSGAGSGTGASQCDPGLALPPLGESSP